MKSINSNYFIAFGVLLLAGAGFMYFGTQSGDLRVPASSENLKVIPEIVLDKVDTNDGFEIYLGFEDEELNICDEEEELILSLTPVGLVVHSDTEHEDHKGDDEISLEIVNGCERGFVSPIFMKNFCGNANLNVEDDEGTTYELKNSPGIFPLNWKVNKLTIGTIEVSMENQLGLSEYKFSCE